MKPWANHINQYIQDWSSQLVPLGWWPKFVYHFTNIQNAVSILNSGQLYSRNEAIRRGLMQTDNASPDVIQHTRTGHKDFVRLYFRPRTPTQYRNEGIRPIDTLQLGGAHCPIPIFFCFDSDAVLSSNDTQFSNGNMGSSLAIYGDSLDFFKSIPFRYVFHNGAFPPEERDTIIFHRNAEVLVPNQLNFEHLKWLVCRSAAERQMFLRLLPSNLRTQWERRTRLSEQGFFERKWSYVEEVIAVNDQIVFRFNPNTSTPGPFSIRFEYAESESSDVRVWEGQGLTNNVIRLKVSNAVYGQVKLYLDDILAFQDMILFEDIPF